MARLRLFANLREIAGAAVVEIPGDTVADVLAAAVDRFGADFGRALGPAQVWVDGHRAPTTAAVGAESEVAVIPPVSGGAMVVRSPMVIEIGIVALMAAALFGANEISLQWFAVVVVAIGAVWVYDLAGAADRRGLDIAYAPGFLGVLGGALGTYRFGAVGMAVATVGAVLLALVWSVGSHRLRPIDSVAAGATIALMAAFGVSAFVLLRLRSRDETLVFLAAATLAVAVSWLSDRSEMPIVDPLVALLVGAIVGGTVAGAIWAPDLVSAIAGSFAAAIALVAGRNLGTLLRAGGFFVTGTLPGSLAYLDGVVLAAGAYWAILTILS
jgi:molybdopterin synthase sulfur carrier subunit